VIARSPPRIADVRAVWRPSAIRLPRKTRGRFAASLVPRRGKLLDFAVHRSPRSIHRVHSRSQPSERRGQPPHPRARLAFDCPVHVHFRIGNANRPLSIHKAPPRVVTSEIRRSCPHRPETQETQLLCHQAKMRFSIVPSWFIDSCALPRFLPSACGFNYGTSGRTPPCLFGFT
jgi:hypothetical protein